MSFWWEHSFLGTHMACKFVATFDYLYGRSCFYIGSQGWQSFDRVSCVAQALIYILLLVLYRWQLALKELPEENHAGSRIDQS